MFIDDENVNSFSTRRTQGFEFYLFLLYYIIHILQTIYRSKTLYIIINVLRDLYYDN